MNQLKSYHKTLILIAVLFITPITGAGIDIYTPVMPVVAKFFLTNSNMIQLSITFYIIGYGVSQVFTGILADSFGRKPIIIINLSTYTLCAFLCTLTHNIYIFLMLRFLQGIFVSGPGVINKAFLIDTREPSKVQSYLNYVTISWATGLILAPVLGGYLYHFSHNWKSIFYFLSSYSFIALCIFCITPETIPSKKALSFKRAALDIVMLFKNKRYVTSVFCVGLIYSLLVSFSLFAPFIIINEMGYTAVFYGKIAILIGLSWFLGNTTARFISGTGMTKHAVSICFASACFIALISILMHQISLTSIIIPSTLIITLMSFGFPKFYGLSVRIFPNIAGLAGAVMGSLFLIITGVVTIILSTLPITITTLLSTYAILCFICFILYLCFIKHLYLVQTNRNT